jgi:hypothetical protein
LKPKRQIYWVHFETQQSSKNSFGGKNIRKNYTARPKMEFIGQKMKGIALLSVVYRVLAKILARRLNSLLEQILGDLENVASDTVDQRLTTSS